MATVSNERMEKEVGGNAYPEVVAISEGQIVTFKSAETADEARLKALAEAKEKEL